MIRLAQVRTSSNFASKHAHIQAELNFRLGYASVRQGRGEVRAALVIASSCPRERGTIRRGSYQYFHRTVNATRTLDSVMVLDPSIQQNPGELVLCSDCGK